MHTFVYFSHACITKKTSFFGSNWFYSTQFGIAAFFYGTSFSGTRDAAHYAAPQGARCEHTGLHHSGHCIRLLSRIYRRLHVIPICNFSSGTYPLFWIACCSPSQCITDSWYYRELGAMVFNEVYYGGCD